MERKVGSGLVGSWSVVSWAVRGQWGVSADGRDWWATHERTVVRPSVCRWPSVSFGRRDRALTTMTTDGRPDGRNPCRFVWSILLRWLRGSVPLTVSKISIAFPAFNTKEWAVDGGFYQVQGPQAHPNGLA
ncbi:unnamed protein product [Sphagnum jensenii]|uniref:Uncharacterized protein n=1 Tax=Sphagnum jensenii TaxID=128206 RepID=A0ABP0WH10_9BRYO